METELHTITACETQHNVYHLKYYSSNHCTAHQGLVSRRVFKIGRRSAGPKPTRTCVGLLNVVVGFQNLNECKTMIRVRLSKQLKLIT